jgi:hypothetical protein
MRYVHTQYGGVEERGANPSVHATSRGALTMAAKIVHFPVTGSITQGRGRSSQFDVFMSYGSSDLPIVRQICDMLRRHDINIWLDLERIEPGAWIQDSLSWALRSSRTVAFMLGAGGIGPWQMAELRLAIDHCITDDTLLIPVLLPGAAQIPDDIPFLRLVNQVNFVHSTSEKAPMCRLVRAIIGRRRSQIERALSPH